MQTMNLLFRIKTMMMDHEWRSVDTICAALNGKPDSVSAAIRKLRNPKHGGLTVEIRNLGKGSEYRVAPTATAVDAPKSSTPEQANPTPKTRARNRRQPYVDPNGLTMGQIIRGRRTQLFISQQQLASMVGVKTQTVGRWELFSLRPRGNKIDAICKALNISKEGLLSGKNRPIAPRPKAVKPVKPKGIDINALALAIAEALRKAST